MKHLIINTSRTIAIQNNYLLQNMSNYFFAITLALLFLPSICISETTSKEWSLNRKSFYPGLNALKSPETSESSTQTSLFLMMNYRMLPQFYSFSDSNNTSGRSHDSGIVNRAVFDMKYSLRTTVSDFLHIYSSPARMTKSDAFIAGGIIALGGVIYLYDQEIHDMLNRNRYEPFYEPVRKVGEFFEPIGYMGFTNKYLFLSLFTGYIFGVEPMVNIPADILESYAISGVVKNGSNIVVGRRRPEAGAGPRSYKFMDGTSFPSGHSLNIVQMASILSYHCDNPAFKIAAYSAATTVCLQRITSDAHWPSDVYSGAVIGWFISHELLKLKRNRKLSISPAFGDDTRNIGIRIGYRF